MTPGHRGVYVAALDLGTTSSRCIIFDRTGSPVGAAQREHRQIMPRPGWVEHDPLEIKRRVDAILRGAMAAADVTAPNLAAVGITNQRETAVVWDRKTGQPICNAIVWQDTRTADICSELARDGGQDRFRAKTGLPLATYFSGPKIRWILDNVPGARARAEAGELAFGTVDSWCIWNLTGGPRGGVHVTDVTNASRTLLLDLETLQWDDELLGLMRIPRAMLPEIRSSSEFYGEAVGRLAGVPIAGVLGDQQAALFGQACFAPGEAKNTYGTGCFMLLNTGTRPVVSKSGLLTTVGYRIGSAPAVYALEGSIAIAGALVQWLRDNMGLIRNAAEVETLARTVEDNGGVYFVPAFSGLFAPYWRADARGAIVGLTRYAGRGHIARAALEATAWQTREVLDAMNADLGVGLKALKVDGGMVHNELLMQFQADVLGVPVIRPRVAETTALGAAYAAGLAVGFWGGLSDLSGQWAEDRRWSPEMPEDRRAREYLELEASGHPDPGLGRARRRRPGRLRQRLPSARQGYRPASTAKRMTFHDAAGRTTSSDSPSSATSSFRCGTTRSGCSRVFVRHGSPPPTTREFGDARARPGAQADARPYRLRGVPIHQEEDEIALLLIESRRDVDRRDTPVLAGVDLRSRDSRPQGRPSRVARGELERMVGRLAPCAVGLGANRGARVDEQGLVGAGDAVGVVEQGDDQRARDHRIARGVDGFAHPPLDRPIRRRLAVRVVVAPDAPFVDRDREPAVDAAPCRRGVGLRNRALDLAVQFHAGSQERLDVAFDLLDVDVDGDVVRELDGLLQHDSIPIERTREPRGRVPGDDQLQLWVELAEPARRLGREPAILLRGLVAELPGTVRLVAKAPHPHAERIRRTVRDPQVRERRSARMVRVFEHVERFRDPSRPEVDRQHRLDPDLAGPGDELMKAEGVRVGLVPGQVEPARTGVSRSDAVLPPVAGDEVAARVADDGHAKVADQRRDILAEPVRVRERAARRVDPAVHAPAQVLDERAE